jgi:two-component system NtrC family sensor kinase
MELIPLILITAGIVQALRKTLDIKEQLPQWDRVLSAIWIVSIGYFLLTLLPGMGFLADWYGKIVMLLLFITFYLLRHQRSTRLFILAVLPYAAIFAINTLLSIVVPGFFEDNRGYFNTAKEFSNLWLIGFGIYAFTQVNKERKQRKKEEEQLRQAEARKAELEHLVVERTTELTTQKEELEKTLDELRSAQAQLIHSEKMASLGELTAGIAHEIQNPLNFVNNFSELSIELAHELRDELEKPGRDEDLIRDLMQDLVQNQEKINHHGKRAAGIVTAMLQHSRAGSGKKEPTDLNALADEYLRLSYHGLRAKDKSFNAKMVTDLDPAIGKVEAVAQDLGRVLLNLINNAFYAVQQRERQLSEGSGKRPENFSPTVSVSTKQLKNAIEIRIKDNGTGIPDDLKAKIFQPFFTTKPTGQGTGLGLSLAFDIITKGHGGQMKMESTEGKGTEFTIRLPA